MLLFQVRYWPNGDDIRSAEDVNTDRAVTEAVVYGIQKDIVYQCRVFGVSRGGEGRHSQTVYFTLGKCFTRGRCIAFGRCFTL